MSKKSDAAVGRLAVMDGALNQLLCEIVIEIGVKVGDSKKVAEDLLQVVKSHPALFTRETTEWFEGVVRVAGKRDVSGPTTGRAAQALLAHAKSDAALLPHDVTAWLKRVDQAAIKRNTIMHAIAHDQCVICGNATRFAHKGKPVDRSTQAVAATVGFGESHWAGVRAATIWPTRGPAGPYLSTIAGAGRVCGEARARPWLARRVRLRGPVSCQGLQGRRCRRRELAGPCTTAAVCWRAGVPVLSGNVPGTVRA